MNTHSLDSILGPADADPGTDPGDVISSVRQIVPCGEGVIVDVSRTDVVSGQGTAALVRLGASGAHSVTVSLTECNETIARNVMSVISDDALPGLVVGADRVWCLDDRVQTRADAINAMALDGIARIAEGEGVCVVLADGVLHMLRDTGGSVELAMAPLGLGGWRYPGQMIIRGQALYAAVTDPVSGFDLFRADLTAGKPSFEPVMTRGAQRFAVNAVVPAMCLTERGLLLGTAALAPPANAVGDWGPELLLLTQDDKTDLIVGQPRFSPRGLLLPASSQMPGMGQPENAAIAAIAYRDGETFIALQDFAGAPQEDRRNVTPDLFDYRGAVRLYRSADLETWDEVPHRLGRAPGPVTALGATAQGLVIGHEGLGEDALPVAFVPFTVESR